MKNVQLTLLAVILAIGISVFITTGCQPEEPKNPEIFKVVEQMPRFPGCEETGSEEEKQDCAKTKMLQYIYKNLKYPAIAREKGAEGMAVLQFVVTETGKIDDVKIVRDIGAGCGDAGKKVVLAMNNLAFLLQILFLHNLGI